MDDALQLDMRSRATERALQGTYAPDMGIIEMQDMLRLCDRRFSQAKIECMRSKPWKPCLCGEWRTMSLSVSLLQQSKSDY